MFIRPIAVILLATAIAGIGGGCGRGNPDTWLDGVVRQPKPKGSPVDIFLGDKRPTQPYVESRIIRFEATNKAGKIELILREKARAFGADGVIVNSNRGQWQSGGVFKMGSDGGDIIEAITIVYESPSAPTGPQSPNR